MRHAQNPDVLAADHGNLRVNPLRLSVPIAALVVLADQLTKRWALSALLPGSCAQEDACIDLFAGIKFHLVFNTGAAFTRGSGYGPVLAILAFFMAGLLIYLSRRREDRWGIALFGATAGGAVGNLLDRIFRADDGFLSGAVIDFIDFGWWPVFNIADSAIVLGVIGIIILSILEAPQPETSDRQEPDGPDPATTAQSDAAVEADRSVEADHPVDAMVDEVATGNAGDQSE